MQGPSPTDEIDSASAWAGTASLDPVTRDQQRLRLQRLLMAAVSYVATAGLVLFAWANGMIEWHVARLFLLFVAAVNLMFLAAFLSNLNLRFKDASLTAPQMVLSILPSLYVMYFLEDGQARAVLLLLCILPGLYGILRLDVRRFLMVMTCFVACYVALVLLLWWRKPENFDVPVEVLQLLAILLVSVHMALLGGYINGLRSNLRVRNAELRAALHENRELAIRDALTGSFNRRHLMDLLTDHVARPAPTPVLTICLLDVDNFKAVNDRYGHAAGDLVLRQVAAAIEADLRSTDSFGRYGGEEFLLILAGTPAAGARAKAERIRKIVSQLSFDDIAAQFRVSVSAGIAEHQPGEDIEAAIKRADAALYRAKAAGRDRVCVAEPPAGSESPGH